MPTGSAAARGGTSSPGTMAGIGCSARRATTPCGATTAATSSTAAPTPTAAQAGAGGTPWSTARADRPATRASGEGRVGRGLERAPQDRERLAQRALPGGPEEAAGPLREPHGDAQFPEPPDEGEALGPHLPF